MEPSEKQKAIYAAFTLAGLTNVNCTFSSSGVKYVKGTTGTKEYVFSHRDYGGVSTYMLTCNDKILYTGYDPQDLREVIDKIIANPNGDIEKSSKSAF